MTQRNKQALDNADWAMVCRTAKECGITPDEAAEQQHAAWVQSKNWKARPLPTDLKLLAILTGFSVAGVSKAVRGIGGVLKPADTKCVQNLAEALAYHSQNRLPKPWPDDKADVAVATEFLSKPSFSYHEDILRSLTRALEPAKGRLTLFDLSDRITRDRFFSEPPNLTEYSGLILINTQSTLKELEALSRSYPTTPVVLIHDNRLKQGDNRADDKYPALVVANIFPDLKTQESGYRILIRHVLEKHNRTLPVLAMVPPGSVETRKIKRDVFEEECKRLGLKANVYDELPEYTVNAGVGLLAHVQSRFGQRVDALICLSDAVAVGVQSQLRAGSDILVTGFDDNQLAKAFAISSVDQGLAETGSRALSALAKGIQTWRDDGESSFVLHLVPVLPAIRCCQDF